jgi:hypothetical protein
LPPDPESPESLVEGNGQHGEYVRALHRGADLFLSLGNREYQHYSMRCLYVCPLNICAYVTDVASIHHQDLSALRVG